MLRDRTIRELRQSIGGGRGQFEGLKDRQLVGEVVGAITAVRSCPTSEFVHAVSSNPTPIADRLKKLCKSKKQTIDLFNFNFLT
jgi:hypothetical protein